MPALRSALLDESGAACAAATASGGSPATRSRSGFGRISAMTVSGQAALATLNQAPENPAAQGAAQSMVQEEIEADFS